MASIHRDPATGVWNISFRFGGKPHHKSLRTKQEAKAQDEKGRISKTLEAIENGWLPLPPDADFWEFVWSDGRVKSKLVLSDVLTLEKLFARYEEEMPPGAMEENSLATCRLHKKHLLDALGKTITAQSVTTSDLQRYVNKRSKDEYRGKTISPRTIKKEVATFRAVWNWGKLHGLVTGDAPTTGLKYDKEEEKHGFLTWAEIEQRIHRGGLTDDEVPELWSALFLSPQQITECLEHVKANAAYAFIYPMFVFVAYTGARRSEMCRSRVEDFDFETKRVCVREKKKDRSVKETRRYVDMTPLLEQVMKSWLTKEYPGGPFTFCHGDVVSRSRKRSKTTGHRGEKTRASSYRGRIAEVRERNEKPGRGPLTLNEATDHFKRTLAGSKWEVVRGFHVFRHSFASNLARAGIRQDVIDGMMGHQTEQMRRRYRHLFPQETRDALRKVFEN